MSTPAVAANVGAAIASALTLTYGTSVRTGPPVPPSPQGSTATKAVPDQCIFVLKTTGLPDVPYVDGDTKTAEKKFGLQITVRSKKNDYDSGETLADAVFEAVDKKPPTGYSECRALNSGPTYLGRDESGHHIWTINVIVKHDPT